MKGLKIGVWIVTLIALFTIFAPFFADWNETHIYNPRWTPHAKYHNAQTMAFGPVLGALTLYFLWGRRGGDEQSNVSLAILFASLYYATQLLAFLFPGVAAVDPEFAANVPTLLGLPGQLAMDIVIFALLGTAYLLEQKRITGQTGGQSR